MKHARPLIFCGELFLYQATIGYFLSGFGCRLNVLPVAAIMLAMELGCWLLRQKAIPLRLLLLLPFAGLFFYDPRVSSLLYLLPPLLLFGTRAVSGHWDSERETIQNLMIGSLVLYLILTLINALNGHYQQMMSATLGNFIIWLMLAVFSLRLMRLPAGDDRRLPALNACLLSGLVLVSFLASRPAVTGAVASLIKILYRYALMPLILVCVVIVCAIPAAIIYGVAYLIQVSSKGNMHEVNIKMGESAQELLGEVNESGIVRPDWIRNGLITLGVILFALLAFLIVRRLTARGAPAEEKHRGLVRETITETQGSSKPRYRKPDPHAGSIRGSYRKYLKLCEKLGIDTDGTLASDGVARDSSRFFSEENAERLRELWLPARYGYSSGSSADAKEAADLVRDMAKSIRKQH